MAPTVISKYFVMGVLLAFCSGMNPLDDAGLISDDPELHGMCGFTEDDVRTLVRNYLHKDGEDLDRIIDTMRTLYNGYTFTTYTKESGLMFPTLFNPQLVLSFISKFNASGYVAFPNDYTSVYSSHILQHITDNGAFSVNDLMKLMMRDMSTQELLMHSGTTIF